MPGNNQLTVDTRRQHSAAFSILSLLTQKVASVRGLKKSFKEGQYHAHDQGLEAG